MAEIIHARHLRGAEIRDVAGRADLALLPVGALEWHGPHLPLGTDSLIADGFASQLSGGATAVLFPAIAYSACPGKTRSYQGTVAVRPETAVAYLSDVLDGIVAAGFERVLVVNAHDANMAVARAAMEWVSGYRRSSFLLVNWFQLVPAAETAELFGDARVRGHGGAYESAAVLAFAPNSVDTAGVPDIEPREKLSTAFPYALIESSPDPWDGWSGLISLVDEETSQEIERRAARRLGEMVDDWIAQPLPAAPPVSARPNPQQPVVPQPKSAS